MSNPHSGPTWLSRPSGFTSPTVSSGKQKLLGLGHEPPCESVDGLLLRDGCQHDRERAEVLYLVNTGDASGRSLRWG
jgi:hypothetical protein